MIGIEMLKLEKSRESGIAIRLRPKERFFEPTLIKAFALALFLHLGGLALFHIAPFSMSSSFLFPPIHVQSQINRPASATTLHSIEQTGDSFMLPPLALIPLTDLGEEINLSDLAPFHSFDPKAYQELEETLWPLWESPFSIPMEGPKIMVTISGDLARFPLIKKDPILDELHPIGEPLHSISYRVKMDKETGELFWFERENSSGKKEIDRLTENILSHFIFGTDGHFDAIDGSLDFILFSNIFN
jgi:hypothetical protein